MRRFLFGAGCYLAGILTLPLLSIGLNRLDARIVSHDQPYRGLTVEKATRTSDPVAIMVSPGRDSTCQVMLPAAGQCGAAHAPVLAMTDAFGQADVKAADVAPFGQDEPALEFPEPEHFDEPEPHATVNPPILRGGNFPLPIGPEALAGGAEPDEAGAAKIKDVRESLKKVFDEKLELLSLIGLEAELKSHQTHLAELKSLKELLALKQSLTELRDKFPDSDAGRRATELLNLLEQQQQRGVEWRPGSPFEESFGDSPRTYSPPDIPIKAKGKPTY